MVSNPITNTLQKFAAQNIAHGIKENLPLNRVHFSGPSGGGYQQHVYHEYDGGHGHGHGGHGHSSHGGGGKKRSIALSALTLLAFLYFLNILQNCLEEQMEAATAAPQQVIVMASRLHQHYREEELPQETSKSGSSESGSVEDRQDIDKKIFEQDNFQRIDNYFNSTLHHNKKHKKGKL